jgi:hypothetical protein
VASDVAGRLAAAGRVTDMDGVARVEVGDELGDVGGVVVHVVTVGDLARPTVTAPVVGDYAIALLEEVEHLRIPVIGAQRQPW